MLVCLALEHVDAFEATFHEVARVLEPGGRFVLVLSHPLLQAPGSGWIDDRVADEHYWRIGSYLQEHVVVDEVSPGVAFRFIHRPLSRYVNAMSDAGLLIDELHEPAPPSRFITETWDYVEAATIPRILVASHAARRSQWRSRPLTGPVSTRFLSRALVETGAVMERIASTSRARGPDPPTPRAAPRADHRDRRRARARASDRPRHSRMRRNDF